MTSTIPFGSCDLLIYRMAKLAHEKGHEVLLSVNDFKHQHHQNYTAIEQQGVKVDRRKMYDGSSFFTRLSYKIEDKLIGLQRHFENCAAFKPDYIFVSNQGTYDAIGSPLAEWLSATSTPYALLSNFNQELNGLPAGLYHKARTIFARADKLFFVSKRNLEVAKRTLALPLDQAIEICNPLSGTGTGYIAYPMRNIPVMCMVARLECDVKCHDLLVSILARPYWKEKEWKLNIYGEGPHKEYLHDLIRFYGLEDKIFLQGYRNAIEDIWSENQLLLMVSASEGTPISLLSALVAGRTAVVTDVGGCAEYLEDNKTGFVADAPTVKNVHEALDRAWAHREEWENFGWSARKSALNKIDFKPEETVLAAISK